MTANLSDNFTMNAGTMTTVTTTKIICVAFLLLTLLFGLVINALYLWILCLRMRRNLNIVWFPHLILCNEIYILTIPFLSIAFLFPGQWVLGEFMCKFVNFLLSFSMYANVYFLTAISVDRYWLVFHPHSYRKHMQTRLSSIICIFLWGLAFLCGSPYLIFRRIRQEKNISICYNDYTLTGKQEIELEAKVKWAVLCFRLLGAYLIPIVTITICYLRIGLKIKKENLTKSKKPYKIMSIAVISFFVCWTPYHVWYGMNKEKGFFRSSTLEVWTVLSIILACCNACFTPILYLFFVKQFKTNFKKSIMSIFQTALNEAFLKSTDNRSEQHSVSIRKCESQEVIKSDIF